jgi:hypothetical protein
MTFRSAIDGLDKQVQQTSVVKVSAELGMSLDRTCMCSITKIKTSTMRCSIEKHETVYNQLLHVSAHLGNYQRAPSTTMRSV